MAAVAAGRKEEYREIYEWIEKVIIVLFIQ